MTTTTPPLTALRSVGVFAAWWVASFLTLFTLWIGANFGQLELEQFIYHVTHFSEVVKPMSLGFVVLSFLLVQAVPTSVALLAVWFVRSGTTAPRARRSGESRLSVFRVSRLALAGVLIPSLVLGVSAPGLFTTLGIQHPHGRRGEKRGVEC
jgi:hypothetical protein